MCDICYSCFSNPQEHSEHQKAQANVLNAMDCESGHSEPARSTPASNDNVNTEPLVDTKVPEQKPGKRIEPQEEVSMVIPNAIFCNVCGKDVLLMEDMVGHQNAFHPDHKYKCSSPNCHFIYATISGRIKHMKHKHEMTVKGGYICTKWKLVFDTLDKKTAHNCYFMATENVCKFCSKKVNPS